MQKSPYSAYDNETVQAQYEYVAKGSFQNFQDTKACSSLTSINEQPVVKQTPNLIQLPADSIRSYRIGQLMFVRLAIFTRVVMEIVVIPLLTHKTSLLAHYIGSIRASRIAALYPQDWTCVSPCLAKSCGQ